MRKLLLSISILLAFSLGTFVSANISPKILVNNVPLNSECIVSNDRIYVPLRAVSEAMGADVKWDAETSTASITYTNEDNISQMIADVSQSVVAIVGNYKDNTLNDHVEATAHGTGVIIKSGGEILTNAHVVKNLETIIVVMSDGLGFQARLKYIDEAIDLAVIKIDRLGLKPIKYADPSEIETGKTVFAIGTPVSFSLRNSTSRGIISGINCSVGSYYRLIQTDAAINPGNSGGPLVNMKGELVGINSSKFMSMGIEGMGFSIPVDTVRYTLSQFDNYGKVRRAVTGITFEESWASKMGLPTWDGLTVTKVAAGSKGAAAGIMEGDVVSHIGGTLVHSLIDYNETTKNYSMGTAVNFTVIRNGQTMDINVLLDDN